MNYKWSRFDDVEDNRRTERQSQTKEAEKMTFNEIRWIHFQRRKPFITQAEAQKPIEYSSHFKREFSSFRTHFSFTKTIERIRERLFTIVMYLALSLSVCACVCSYECDVWFLQWNLSFG